MNPTIWSQPERVLLRTLTCKVRMLRERDARLLWRHSSKRHSARFDRAVERLLGAGLLERYVVNLHPPLDPAGPVLKRSSADTSCPDYVETSRRLRQRWSRPCRPTPVFVASRSVANLFGSTSRGLPDLLHRNHDALLGEVYLRYAIQAPKLARLWVGEHVLAKAGFQVKDPDALLARDGRPFRIVESGGSYAASHLASLAEYADRRSLELEVW